MKTATARSGADVGRQAAGSARRAAGLAVVLTLGLVGCAGEPPLAGPGTVPATAGPTAARTTPTATTPAPTAVATATGAEQIAFLSVVDGDTIETSAGTVRIIGIDAPERGECGHDEASAAIASLLSGGDPVTLELPAGENDQDRHARLLRYVLTGAGVDLGLMQLQEGNAIARYDSSDGYPAHPNESAYHAAQIASSGPDGSVLTVACQGQAPLPVAPPASEHWWEQYPSCTKLKKNTAGHPTGPFDRDDPAQAEIYDWFANRTGNRGDGDGDGLACE